MHHLVFSQRLPIGVDACWDFFASVKNLPTLTPPYLGFIAEEHDRDMYAGQIIIHHVRPFRWWPAMRWVTEISHVDNSNYFIDEQRLGPYKFWHHEHRFIAIQNGVEIQDKIHYELPFGLLGRILNRYKIESDLRKIFLYRKAKLVELFGEYR